MKVEFIDNFYPEEIDNAEVVLVELLKSKSLKVSVAESFTGGKISSLITSVSGASAVFYEGIVAYNENAKMQRLGVENQTISEFKPVSYQVASEMAQGLLKSKNADLGVSTTGIAGPKSDESGFPVGLCFIGISYKQKIAVYKFNFNGNREEIVKKGAKTALLLAINTIKTYKG
ncbi:MAG: CinA family protein [Clostridia bacterium]|nr:CinA family protein [Clostridia bacterium]